MYTSAAILLVLIHRTHLILPLYFHLIIIERKLNRISARRGLPSTFCLDSNNHQDVGELRGRIISRRVFPIVLGRFQAAKKNEAGFSSKRCRFLFKNSVERPAEEQRGLAKISKGGWVERGVTTKLPPPCPFLMRLQKKLGCLETAI